MMQITDLMNDITGITNIRKEIQKITEITNIGEIHIGVDKAKEEVSEVKKAVEELSEGLEAGAAGIEFIDKLEKADLAGVVNAAGEAISVLANPTPWNLASAGVSLMLGVIREVREEIRRSEEEANALYNALEEIESGSREAMSAIGETFQGTAENLEDARWRLGMIEEMLSGGASDSSMATAVQALCDVLPQADQYIDRVNGKWVIQKSTIEDVIEQELALAELRKLLEERAQLEADLEALQTGERAAITSELHQNANREWDWARDAYNEGNMQNAIYFYNNWRRIQDQIDDYDDQVYQKRRELELHDEAIHGYLLDESSDDQKAVAVAPYMQDLQAVGQGYTDELRILDNALAALNVGNLAAAENWTGEDFANDAEAAAWIQHAMDELAVEFGMGLHEALADIRTEYGDQLSEADRAALDSLGEEVMRIISETPASMEEALGWIRELEIPVKVVLATGAEDQYVYTIGEGTSIENGPEYRVDRNAEGTSYYPGGLTQINERGDEMVELPEGSRIYPAQRSREYVEVSRGGGNYTVNVYGMTVREEADVDRVASALYRKLQLAAMNR